MCLSVQNYEFFSEFRVDRLRFYSPSPAARSGCAPLQTADPVRCCALAGSSLVVAGVSGPCGNKFGSASDMRYLCLRLCAIFSNFVISAAPIAAGSASRRRPPSSWRWSRRSPPCCANRRRRPGPDAPIRVSTLPITWRTSMFRSPSPSRSSCSASSISCCRATSPSIRSRRLRPMPMRGSMPANASTVISSNRARIPSRGTSRGNTTCRSMSAA